MNSGRPGKGGSVAEERLSRGQSFNRVLGAGGAGLALLFVAGCGGEEDDEEEEDDD